MSRRQPASTQIAAPQGVAALWPRLGELPLVVKACEFERLQADPSFGVERTTTQIRLLGGGTDGLGEDICPFPDERDALPSLPLAGEWTLERFCEHLATLEQWPTPPVWQVARQYRNWAYESAALDLALRQAGCALHDVLELRPRPVRFVNSFGLGNPPATRTLRDRLARYPSLRFKLDAVPAWTAALTTEVAATGAVESIDFKGHYGHEVCDGESLIALYDRVLVAFPHALLEDPHDVPEITARLAPQIDRVSYDAPIRTAQDLDSTPLAAPNVNVKPSRIGGLRPLLDLYAHCQAQGVRMYGGGMGELGVGRGQIQLLASLFHADAPNDVAPSATTQQTHQTICPAARCPHARPRSAFAGSQTAPDDVRSCDAPQFTSSAPGSPASCGVRCRGRTVRRRTPGYPGSRDLVRRARRTAG